MSKLRAGNGLGLMPAYKLKRGKHINGFLNDLRLGLRQLRRSPGFAAAAILTLALGIGANTAVFSVLNGYLLKPLPYPQSDQLTGVWVQLPKYTGDMDMLGSLPLYGAVKNHAAAFASIAAVTLAPFNLQTNGRSRVVHGARATASLFRVLGIQPLLGHVFTAANNRPGRGRVAVLGYRLWQKTFSGNPGVIGRTVKLDGRVYRIQAVMPPDFALPSPNGTRPDLWIPETIGATSLTGNPLNLGYLVIGRLAPHASRQALTQQLKSIQPRIVNMLSGQPAAMIKQSGFRLDAQPLGRYVTGEQTTRLLLLQAAVALILLIACINVANLLLSRILGRNHEMAMRSALGASRTALVRQLLVEALCLAVPGAVAGILMGWLCLRFIAVSLVGAGSGVNIALDWRVGLFALGALCVTSVLVGFLPIFHLRNADLQSLLQEGGHSATGGHHARRVRGVLAIAELTLATALLAGAGLLLHSFVNLEHVNTGFNANGLWTGRLRVPAGALIPGGPGFDSGKYQKRYASAMTSVRSDLLRRAKTLPGVEYAATSEWVPFGDNISSGIFIARGKPKSRRWALTDAVTLDYFKVLNVPLLRGRFFNAEDTADSPPVVIVSRGFADQFFNGHAIGMEIAKGGMPKTAKWMRIVGVVPAFKVQGLGKNEEFGPANSRNQIYLPAAQAQGAFLGHTSLILRTVIPPQMLTKPLRKMLATVSPTAAIYHVGTERQLLSSSLNNKRTIMLLLLAFGGIALALAVVGVYGVMSYAAGQRRAECGIRLALGALPENLLWLIIKDGLKLLGIGLIAGLGLAVIFGFVLSSQLFGIAPYDPITLIGTVFVLAMITLLACWLPAHRAAKLDPAIAMMEQ